MEPLRVVPFPQEGSHTPAPRRMRKFRAIEPDSVRVPAPAPISPPPASESSQPSRRVPMEFPEGRHPRQMRSLRESRMLTQAQAEVNRLAPEERNDIQEIANQLRQEMEVQVAQVLELQIPAETKANLISRMLYFLAAIFLVIPPPEEQYRLYQQARQGIRVRRKPHSG